MSNIDDQIAEISRQIQSLSESTIQHGQGFISSTPRDQGVRPKVVENREHDSGVVTTGPSLSAFSGLAVGDTLPLPDGDIISNPHMSNRKSMGQDKNNHFHPKQYLTKNQSTAHTVCSGSNDVKIKPSKYDGNTPWMDYLSHFEMCALVNMWFEHHKGFYLALSLFGQAQAVLGNLPKEKRQIFSDLVYALEKRFAPSSQTELYRVEFKERRQKASETLPELGQSVRRLSNLAYPTAPLELRDTLAKEQFLDALVDSEMRLRIKQSRPKGLNKAIRLAVELEAYNKAESRTMKNMGHLRHTTSDERTEAPKSPDTTVSMGQMTAWIQTIENSLQSLTKELRDLKYTRKFQPRGKINSAQSKASEDAGMFVELSIQDVPVKFVVDTGAALTLVSTRVYDLIHDLCRPHMSKTRSQIKSVCDKYISLRGKGSFKMDFGKEKFTSEAVVTDLQVDGILGTQNRNADVHTKRCRLTPDRQSKTNHDCSKREQSQVNIVTSQMPDKGRRLDDLERDILKLQAVIPMSERKQVLQYCHERKYAGHLGTHKTLDKIRQSYYWPGLQSDVRAYVAGCDKCARRKTRMKR
ncbi:unnamed protein product [Mytilus coruscus]|uniref:Integrase zinc-binding domain-containing protein n=1 Tax=Mytilus coruscus TaxID=42192 RepID=A0A6J8ATT1_MYTCO|nr:unnamed protein product [Mytilus coruscus]